MLRVHRVTLQTDRFAHFTSPLGEEFIRQFKFDGTQIPGDPQVVELEVPQIARAGSGLPDPDIWSWCNRQHIMVLNERAYECLETLMYGVGQVIPYFFEGQRYMIVNHTQGCVDNLIERKSRRAADGTYTKYSFDPTNLGLTLFSVPQTNQRELYAYENDGWGRRGMFKTIVEDNTLTGVGFEQIFACNSAY